MALDDIADFFERIVFSFPEFVKDVFVITKEFKDGVKEDFETLKIELGFGNSSPHDKKDKKNTPQFGDVICVKKIGYYHFGIYINDNSIIHFAPDGDFSTILESMKNAYIHETNLEKFMSGQYELFVCDFNEFYSEPSKRKVDTVLTRSILPPPVLDSELMKELTYKLYSPAETVERALGKVGKSNYSLVFNNCEHFVIWCKTGIHESHQVNNIWGFVLKIPVCY